MNAWDYFKILNVAIFINKDEAIVFWLDNALSFWLDGGENTLPRELL